MEYAKVNSNFEFTSVHYWGRVIKMMKIKKLIKNYPEIIIKGSKELEITGICTNSKILAPGNLFVAKKGLTTDGTRYIPDAIAAGAVAVLTDIYDPNYKQLTQLIHPNIRQMEACLAETFYEYPSSQLYMVGITGTNGKTTVSYLVKHLLDHIQGPCGLIGTVEYVLGNHRLQATRTTPEVFINHKMLHEMVASGCKSAVMEVTSHALDQGRVENIDYDAALFTNLTQDHLDYHETMEEYCAAKSRLFSYTNPNSLSPRKQYPKVAIVNADDPWHAKVVHKSQRNIYTYGIDHDADLTATNIFFDINQTYFDVCYQGRKIPCILPLVGKFNVYNCLASLSLGLINGASLESLIKLVATFVSVPGRLEAVPNELSLKIFVDYAHTDDALKNILICLKEMKHRRIITVFGCGGDRDRSKRSKMAHVAGLYSDLCIVTSDNPRSESPNAIIDEIIVGFSSEDRYEIVVNRQEAIGRAIELASPDDIIIIAGKGHEKYQIYSHKTVEFDDRVVAQTICKNTIII